MKKFYLLLILSCFLVGCEKEEFSSEIEIASERKLEEIPFDKLSGSIVEDLARKNYYRKTEVGKNPFGGIREDIPVKKIIDDKGLSSYTFGLSPSKSHRSKEVTSFYFDNLFLFENGFGENEMVVIRYEPTDAWYNHSRDFREYSGEITFFTPQGEKINSLQMTNGEIEKEKTSEKGLIRVCYWELVKTETVYSGPEGSMEDENYIATVIYTYDKKCHDIQDGDTSGGGDSYYSPDPNNEPPAPGEFPALGGGGTTPIMPEPDEEVAFEVIRAPSFTKIDKINCTYERLEETVSLKEILKDFFGEDAMFNMTFTVKQDLVCNGSSEASGCATKIDDYNYQISIDEDYILDNKTPTIFLAQTLIHESIHANLFAAVVKLNNGILPQDTSFEALYENYRSKKGWHHDAMAERYIGIMQAALEEVHPFLNDDLFINHYSEFDQSYWKWSEFYEVISYHGLQETGKGIKYFENNEFDISKYTEETEANSTTKPHCNE